MTDETANFLSVGVQLLPVLWLLLGVETTWLRSQLRPAEQTFQRAAAQQVLGLSFLVGAVAECLALFVLSRRGQRRSG